MHKTSFIWQTHFSTIVENRLMYDMGISDWEGHYIPSAATVHTTRIPPLEQSLMSYQNYWLLLTIRSLCCGTISEVASLGEYVTLATLGYIPETQSSHPKDTPWQISAVHPWDYITVSMLGGIYWKIMQRWELMNPASEADTILVCLPS